MHRDLQNLHDISQYNEIIKILNSHPLPIPTINFKITKLKSSRLKSYKTPIIKNFSQY